MSYAIHPTSFRLKYSSKLWGYSAISSFDKYCYKTVKYQLVLNKFLPRLLFLFGLIAIKFKIFFTENLNLYAVVFKIKQGGGTRVKKKLIKRVRGYKPFSYRWWAFFNKQTNFFYNYDYSIEDDEFAFYNLEFSDAKNWYFWKLFKKLMFKKIKNKIFTFKNFKKALFSKKKLSFFNKLKKKKFNFLLRERTNFFFDDISSNSSFAPVNAKILTNFKFFKDFETELLSRGGAGFSSAFLKNNLVTNNISRNNSLEVLKDFTKIFFINNPKIIYFAYLLKIFNKIKKIFFLKNYFRFFWKISFLKFIKIKPSVVKKINGYQYSKRLTNFFLKNISLKKLVNKKVSTSKFFLLKKKSLIKKVKKTSIKKKKKFLKILVNKKKRKKQIKFLKLKKFFYKLSKRKRRLWVRRKRMQIFKVATKFFKRVKIKPRRHYLPLKTIRGTKRVAVSPHMRIIKFFFYLNFLSTVLSNYSSKKITFSFKKLNYFFNNFKKKYRLFSFFLLKKKFFGTKLQKKFIKTLFQKNLLKNRKNRLFWRKKNTNFNNNKIKKKISKIVFSFSKFKKFVLPSLNSKTLFSRKNLVASKKKTLIILKSYLLIKKKLKKKKYTNFFLKVDSTKKKTNFLKNTRGYLQYFYFYSSLFYCNNFFFNSLNSNNGNLKIIGKNNNNSKFSHSGYPIISSTEAIIGSRLDNNFIKAVADRSSQNLFYLSFLRFYSAALNSSENISFKKNVLNKFLINSFLKKKYTFFLKKKYKVLKFLFFKKKYVKKNSFKNIFLGKKRIKKKKLNTNKKLFLRSFGKKILNFFLRRGLNSYNRSKWFSRRRYFRNKRFLSKYYNKKTMFWRRGTFLKRTALLTQQLKKNTKSKRGSTGTIIVGKSANWYYHNLKSIFRAYKKFKAINFNKKKKLRILFRSILQRTTKSKKKTITFQKTKLRFVSWRRHRFGKNRFFRGVQRQRKNAPRRLLVRPLFRKKHHYKSISQKRLNKWRRKLLMARKRRTRYFIPWLKHKNLSWKKNILNTLKKAKKIFIKKRDIAKNLKKIQRNRQRFTKKKINLSLRNRSRKKLVVLSRRVTSKNFFFSKKIRIAKKKLIRLRRLVKKIKLRLKIITLKKKKRKTVAVYSNKIQKKLKFFNNFYYFSKKLFFKKKSHLTNNKRTKKKSITLKSNKSVIKFFFNKKKASYIFTKFITDALGRRPATITYNKKLKKKPIFFIKKTFVGLIKKKKLTAKLQFQVNRQNLINKFISRLLPKENKSLTNKNNSIFLKKHTKKSKQYSFTLLKRKKFFLLSRNATRRYRLKTRGWLNYSAQLRKKKGWRKRNQKWIWFLKLKTPAAVWFKQKISKKFKYVPKKNPRNLLFFKKRRNKIKRIATNNNNDLKSQTYLKRFKTKKKMKRLIKRLRYLKKKLIVLNKKLIISLKKNKLLKANNKVLALRKNKKFLILYKKRKFRLLKKRLIFFKNKFDTKRKLLFLKKNYLFLKKSRKFTIRKPVPATNNKLRTVLKNFFYSKFIRKKLFYKQRLLRFLVRRRIKLRRLLRNKKKFIKNLSNRPVIKNFAVSRKIKTNVDFKISKISIKKKINLLIFKKLRRFFNKKYFSKNLGFFKIYNKRARSLKKIFFSKIKSNRQFISKKKNILSYKKSTRYFLNKKKFYKSFFQKFFYKKIRKLAFKKLNLFHAASNKFYGKSNKALSRVAFKLNFFKKKKLFSKLSSKVSKIKKKKKFFL